MNNAHLAKCMSCPEFDPMNYNYISSSNDNPILTTMNKKWIVKNSEMFMETINTVVAYILWRLKKFSEN